MNFMKKLTLAATLVTLCGLSYALVQHVGDFSSYLATKRVVVVKFFLPGCPPCGRLAPIFSQASNTFNGNPDVAFLEVNGQSSRAIASRYGVNSFPVVIIFKNGKEIKRQKGATWSTASLTNAVNQALA